MPKNRLFLLDAFALLYRAHFAFIKNPRRTKSGLNTSAIFGFTNYLLEIMAKEKPTHIGVALDTSVPTFRHIEYPEYKAQRDEAPEDLRTAIPYLYKLLDVLSIPALKLDGFEADDVIGTIISQLPEDEFDIYMVTPDKDYAQLVKDNVYLYRPPSKNDFQFEIYDRQRVIEKYGIPPEQVTDYLGLTGDASDNIPGVPKIGEKTALALLQEYGSLENIIANAENISKKSIKESLLENAEKGRLSKYLATIIRDVPIEYTAEQLKVGGTDMEGLTALLAELEFRTIGQRLMNSVFNPIGPQSQTDLFGNPVGGVVSKNLSKNTATPSITPTIEQNAINEVHGFKTFEGEKAEYILLTEQAQVEKLFTEIREKGFVSFDTETTSLDERSAEMVGMSFALQAKKAYFVYFEDEAAAKKFVAESGIKAILEDENILKIGQNLKYDMQVVKNYGIEVKGKLFDTMIAHYIWKPEGRHGMDDMARELLHYNPISFKDLTNNGKVLLRSLDIEKLKDYAAEDADITFQLYENLKEKVAGNSIFEEIEMPLMPVLMEMEYAGIKIDNVALAEFSNELEKKLVALRSEVFRISGEDFNLDSPAQLGVVLFDKMKIGKGKKTKTGQYSTDEEVLSDLAITHELPGVVLVYRGLKKLKSTYVDALPKLINPITKRVHTTFSQTVAVTGRLSSINPNLQNIPIRSDDGKEVRKGFVCENQDFVLMSADYSQVELRLMAAFSKDENMIQAFKSGEDIHRATASKVFGVPLEEVTSDMRSKAKMVNFGIIYGISAHGLAQRLRISRTEAKTIIDSYFAQYPTVKAFMDSCITRTREQGYIATHFGRKRFLPEITSQNQVVRGIAERNAINSPIQGTAADIIKIAMIHVHKAFQAANLKSRMLLQVHDELVFEVHKSEIEQVKTIVKDCMIHAVDLGVPMDVEVGVGNNWLEAH